MFQGIGGSRIVYNTVLRLKLFISDLKLQGHDLCPFFTILDRNWGKAVLGFPVYTSQAGGQVVKSSNFSHVHQAFHVCYDIKTDPMAWKNQAMWLILINFTFSLILVAFSTVLICCL